MFLRFSAGALAALALTACANLGKPGADELARLPVVRFGEAAPAGQPFILHYPAGAPLPVEARIHGSLLQEEARGVLTVRTKQDLYTYKHWASLDGARFRVLAVGPVRYPDSASGIRTASKRLTRKTLPVRFTTPGVPLRE